MTKTIDKDDGEFIILEETVSDTQKKIKQWISTQYSINILFQHIVTKGSITYLITTLLRKKL